MGVTTLSIRDTFGTDHSSMDTFDHMMPEDVMQASAMIAAMVYEAANAPEMFPRKPLPEKEP